LRLLDFLEEDFREDFRPPPLRLEEDLRRDDFLPPEDLRALPARLRPPFRPALLRPEDPDRDLFLPPLRLLDFLAAAIGKLRVGGFVEPNSKIRAQQR
jgi:hypothetical protein